MTDKSAKLKNNDVNWDEFDPQLYLNSNYATILPPDREIIQKLVCFYEKINPKGEFVEIGCGPNLYPVLSALPYVTTITIVEIGKQNVSYLKKQFDSFDPIWQQWIKLLQETSATYSVDFHQQYKQKVQIKQGSLFDLPQNTYQLASMHFVAESISQDLNEFYLANKCFISTLVSGRIFSASYMENSEGYSSPGNSFPAVKITKKEIDEAIHHSTYDLSIERISNNDGLVRNGHTGMLLALGCKK